MIEIDIFLVGLGGGLASLFRCWIGFLVEKNHGNLPLATFLINISGAFVIDLWLGSKVKPAPSAT